MTTAKTALLVFVLSAVLVAVGIAYLFVRGPGLLLITLGVVGLCMAAVMRSGSSR